MTSDSEPKKFDPTPYMIELKGKNYLPIAPRVFWLRTEHPDAHIHTEAINVTERFALFKATITVPNGGSATGYGSETPDDFKDFLEKAEAKSIGRALAALGYGTLAALEFDDPGEINSPNIVDTPIVRSAPKATAPAQAAPSQPAPKPAPTPKPAPAAAKATQKPAQTTAGSADNLPISKLTEEQRQPILNHISAKQNDIQWSEGDLRDHIRRTYLQEASYEGMALSDLIVSLTLAQCRRLFTDMADVEQATQGVE